MPLSLHPLGINIQGIGGILDLLQLCNEAVKQLFFAALMYDESCLGDTHLSCCIKSLSNTCAWRLN